MLKIPAVSIEAILQGMQRCQIDTQRIRIQLGLREILNDPSETLPNSVWVEAWRLAAQQDSRPQLPSLVALSIPMGFFGPVDYLAGSSMTVRGGLVALADHFSGVASGIQLEVSTHDDGSGGLRIVNAAETGTGSDEFTNAVILGRFKTVSDGTFIPERVYLQRSAVEGQPHKKLFGCDVVYGAAKSGFDASRSALDLELVSANAGLHAVLSEVAKKLGFSDSARNSFEVAVRSRLRSLLPKGEAAADRVALSLGVSERTLHRRLTDLQISYQNVLDQFRSEEAERLLLQGQMSLVDIALALGFSDQASWTRSFSRTHGTSPTAWLSSQRD